MPLRSNSVGRVDLDYQSRFCVNGREGVEENCLRKSEAMNGKAPAMMVESRDWTRKGKKRPAISFHLYRFIFCCSSLQMLHTDESLEL